MAQLIALGLLGYAVERLAVPSVGARGVARTTAPRLAVADLLRDIKCAPAPPVCSARVCPIASSRRAPRARLPARVCLAAHPLTHRPHPHHRLDIPWLAEGDASPDNKQNIPAHVREVLSRHDAPTRVAESPARVAEVRDRAAAAAADAAALRNLLVGEDDSNAWWRTPPTTAAGGRAVTKDEPLRVLIAGGGLAGLVTAAACHAKGMKVAIFEQASSYAPYGGPIQIQSNALRAIERINPQIVEELKAAGTVTADRVSGLKIGYRKGNKLAGLYDRGDWLVRFDTIGPALEAGLNPTIVVDRPVIQQILIKHGFPASLSPLDTSPLATSPLATSHSPYLLPHMPHPSPRVLTHVTSPLVLTIYKYTRHQIRCFLNSTGPGGHSAYRLARRHL